MHFKNNKVINMSNTSFESKNHLKMLNNFPMHMLKGFLFLIQLPDLDI